MDFLPVSSDCRTLEFTSSEGLQTQCSFIEILDDSIIEGDESFTLKLLSGNPQVNLVSSEAIVIIVDDDSDDDATTIATTEMTTMPTERTTMPTERTTMPTEMTTMPTGMTTMPTGGTFLL